MDNKTFFENKINTLSSITFKFKDIVGAGFTITHQPTGRLLGHVKNLKTVDTLVGFDDQFVFDSFSPIEGITKNNILLCRTKNKHEKIQEPNGKYIIDYQFNSEHELDYLIFKTQKIIFLDKFLSDIQKQCRRVINFNHLDLINQLRVIEATQYKIDNTLDLPLLRQTALKFNISLEQASAEVLKQHNLLSDKLAQLEKLREGFSRNIINETDINQLKTIYSLYYNQLVIK